MAEQDQVSFQRGDDTTLLVRFSGAWRLRGGLPSASLVDRELQSAAQVRGVAFDTKELISWDSSVLAFLVELSELCRRRGINMERAGLPAGVRRLLDLAEAVPEKKGARKEAAKATFLERVGHAAIGAGLAFQHDRPAVRHDQAIPSEERTRLSECDLRIVLADQARPLRDQQDFSGRPVIDRPDQMVAEWREPMINITSHGVHFALLQGQLLAGGDQSLGIS